MNYKIAFIQLTRIGDVLQTFMAAKQLKIENPSLELTLIARTKFASELEFLLNEVFDNIVLFDTKDFFNEKNLTSARSHVHNFICDLKEYKFDLVINLSFNKSSSYLTTLISKEHKMGMYRNLNGEIAISDKWSQFIYSNTMTGPLNPFNLVDIYKGIAGAKEVDLTTFQSPRSGIITIHPFASSSKKSWGINKWNEVIYKLLKDRPEVKILIVGASCDQQKAQQITNSPMLSVYKDRIINKVGQNTIEQTFLDLSNSQLFIGHDSMVSHLAALFRIPSIVLAIGTVRPHETSPYNDNAYVMSPRNKCFPCNIQERCDLLPCHSSINYQVVVASAKTLLDNHKLTWENLSRHITPFHIDNTAIYSTSFDQFGIKLVELTNNNDTEKDVFRNLYRVIWSYYLGNREIVGAMPKFNNKTLKVLHHHLEGIHYLFELYGHGFNFCNRILDETEKDNPSMNQIQDNVSKIGEIDQLCDITKNSFQHLAPIVDFFYVNRANAMGKNIIEITNNNLISYHDGSNVVAIFADLVERAISPMINSTTSKSLNI